MIQDGSYVVKKKHYRENLDEVAFHNLLKVAHVDTIRNLAVIIYPDFTTKRHNGNLHRHIRIIDVSELIEISVTYFWDRQSKFTEELG